MGIRDLINSSTETVKRKTRDLSTPVMKVYKASYHYSSAVIRKIDDIRVNGLQKLGIRDLINSGTETVKRKTPDLSTPVMKVYKASYHYSSAAIRKIDDVRVNGVQKLGQHIYMPDEEGRAKIVNFCSKFAKNASVVAVKEAATIFIPGGRAVSQIYSQTVREMEIESKLKNQNTSCDEEITGNSSKNTTTGTGSPGLLDDAETSKRIGNSSKDTATDTGALQLFDGADMPESIGNSTKDTASTGSPELFNGAELPESVGNSSQDTTTTTSSPELLDGPEMSGSRELQLGAAQLSLWPKAKL